jgi:hypothetical protein
MQLVSNLHCAFLCNHEQVPGGRTWSTRFGPHGKTVEDFAIVGRMIDSKTGQFSVTVAGIGPREHKPLASLSLRRATWKKGSPARPLTGRPAISK